MKHINFRDFPEENIREWKNLLDDIFPQGLPLRAEWNDPAEIVAVLNQMGAADQHHYTFLPSYGGLDLHGAKANGDTGLTELYLGSQVWVGKVANLSFESFGEVDTRYWCYFRLELAELPLLPLSPADRDGYLQTLTEIAPGEYRDAHAWDNRFEEGCELPAQARRIVRPLKGSLVTFAKFCPYNMLGNPTNAPHERLDRDGFRARIQQLVDANPHTTTLAQLDELLLPTEPLAFV